MPMPEPHKYAQWPCEKTERQAPSLPEFPVKRERSNDRALIAHSRNF